MSKLILALVLSIATVGAVACSSGGGGGYGGGGSAAPSAAPTY